MINTKDKKYSCFKTATKYGGKKLWERE